MNFEQYNELRNQLFNEAETLISEGKIEDSNAKMQEMTDLDSKWEVIKLANANLNALKDNTSITNIENNSVHIDGGKTLDNTMKHQTVDNKKVYENAWAKHMQGKTLEASEQEVFNTVNTEFSNTYTHSTDNTAILIPETVVAGIWKRAEEMYPFLADVRKFSVRGTLTMKKHVSIDAGDAAFYSESTATADEQNTFGEISLSGCELAKAITISWKLRSMATEEFIPFIIKELGDRVGVALGKAVITGKGATATPREPQGVETALLAEAGTPQIVTYDPDHATTPVPLTYAKMTQAISKIHSSYLNGCAIYANNATIWNQLANLLDTTGRPLFIPDVTSGGVGRMFGMVVKPDAGVSKGNIIIGNANAGYIMNTNEPMSVATEEHVKPRTVDYATYTIVDGAVFDTKAFAMIRDIPTA
ncbi:phage major capsid protein [Bacillus sp. BP-3]|uniref:phage major capsid protein n=1 Tax=Bacillus sp. BP-3 TaxID=3022773 RepID=UPI00232F6196|nr:phage major capsid protein [Bacillus sp. BP-3]MDC2866519.1 phage major capsid protein [Bacillus sp. BP-3]